MSKNEISIDAAQPASLDYGSITDNFNSVQEALDVFEKLPPEKKATATLYSAGKPYTASEIRRLRPK